MSLHDDFNEWAVIGLECPQWLDIWRDPDMRYHVSVHGLHVGPERGYESQNEQLAAVRKLLT